MSTHAVNETVAAADSWSDLLDDPIRVLVVDDDASTRELLAGALSEFGFNVVGGSSDGAEACRMAAILKPEVVLMDVRMPGIDGMDATVLIKARQPSIQVVILTAYLADDLKETAQRRGVASYLSKNSPLEDLADSLRAAGLRHRTSAFWS
jgi:DNA-binding NarL/FixJ family response regulator